MLMLVGLEREMCVHLPDTVLCLSVVSDSRQHFLALGTDSGRVRIVSWPQHGAELIRTVFVGTQITETETSDRVKPTAHIVELHNSVPQGSGPVSHNFHDIFVLSIQ